MFKDVVVLVSVLLSMTFAQTQKEVFDNFKNFSFVTNDSSLIKLKDSCDEFFNEITKLQDEIKKSNNYQNPILNTRILNLKQKLALNQIKIKKESTEILKENYPFYDLTNKNKKKIRSLGVLFTLLGATSAICTIIDGNKEIPVFKDNKLGTENKDNKLGTEKAWNEYHTFNLCFSSVFLISGLVISIDY